METPRRRTALETRTNLAGRSEKPHKPQVAAQQPASGQRPRRSREAADAPPKAARSAQCVRRERGLATWMNFVLAPAGSASDTIGCIGPSLSLHAVERQRQETVLRARMAMLLRGPELGPLLFKVSQQVEDNFLRVRPPLNLTADVGLRDGLLSLLGCYSPVWLRLGLEAVTLESAPAPHEGESEALVLRRFADHRVLQAPAVQLSPPNGRHAEETARRAHARALDAAHKLILKRVLCTMLLVATQPETMSATEYSSSEEEVGCEWSDDDDATTAQDDGKARIKVTDLVRFRRDERLRPL